MTTITRALVTGANGFIGSNLCARLRAQGIPTSGLILPGTNADAIRDLGVDVVGGDIGRPLDSALFQGVSHVFHLAAIPFDWGPGSLFQRVNVQGTEHVLAAAEQAGVAHFVHMSSLAVHAYSGHAHGNEDTPRDGRINSYAVTKNLAEDRVRNYADRMSVTVIRPGVVPYGPGDRLSLPGIVDALDKGIYMHIGGGRARVCLSYVENLADGMILAAQRQGEGCETFVLSDQVVTWREFIEHIARAFDKPVPRRSLPYWPMYGVAFLMESFYKLFRLRAAPPLTRYRISLFYGDLVFSSDKARRMLGYQPKVDLDEGLKRTREWMEKEGLI